MDATTNLEEYFSGIYIPPDTNLSAFMGVGEGGFGGNDLASEPLVANPQSLDLEADVPSSPLSQGDTHQNQYLSGYFPTCGLMQEGLQFNASCGPCNALGHMSTYTGPSYLAIPPQAILRESLELGTNFPVSMLPQSQADLSYPAYFFSLEEQPVTEGNRRCTTTSLASSASTSPVSRLSFSPDLDGRSQADDRMEQVHGSMERADPFPCHLCADSFASKKSLSRHFVVWHRDYALSRGLPVDKFPCYILGCTRSYTRLDNLKRHIDGKHRNPRS